MLKTILFVCIGNICRSPMAEILFQEEAKNKDHSIHVSSAGLNAMQDKPAHPVAQSLMTKKGLDLSSHQGRQITKQIVNESDLILVMTRNQKNELESKFPQAKGKVYRLGHHEGFDVVDPYKRPDAIFDQSLAQIEAGLENWYSMILK